MSDLTTATITPEAPVAPVAAPAPVAQELSAADVIRGLSVPDYAPPPIEAPVATPAPLVDASGRVHGEDGRFVEKAGEGSVAPPEVTAVAEVDGTQVEVEPVAAAEGQLPAGFKRIELPEGHPLRDQGIEALTVSEGEENQVRSLLNNPVRRAELETAQQLAGQLEASLIQHQAALRAANEFNAVLFGDPRVMDTYRAIEADHGQEAAGSWLNGLLAEKNQGIEQYVQEAQASRAAEQHARVAKSFLNTAFAQAPQIYPHWSQQELTNALSAYASFAKVNNAPDLSVEEFRQFADVMYLRHPKVQEQVQAYVTQRTQAEADRIANERAAQARAELARNAALAAENPMGGIPAALHTGQTARVQTESASAQELLRGLRIA